MNIFNSHFLYIQVLFILAILLHGFRPGMTLTSIILIYNMASLICSSKKSHRAVYKARVVGGAGFTPH